jgi:hypothetical protein
MRVFFLRLSLLLLFTVLSVAQAWAGDAPVPSPLAGVVPGVPAPAAPAAPTSETNKRNEDEEAALIITAAGPLDLLALLANARDPLSMINVALAESIEKQAQDLTKSYMEITLARALLVVSRQATEIYKKYTNETLMSGQYHERILALTTSLANAEQRVEELTRQYSIMQQYRTNDKDGLRVH